MVTRESIGAWKTLVGELGIAATGWPAALFW